MSWHLNGLGGWRLQKDKFLNKDETRTKYVFIKNPKVEDDD